MDFLLDLYIFYEQRQSIVRSKIGANRNNKRHDSLKHLCDLFAQDHQVCLQYEAQQDLAGSLSQRHRKVHRTQADEKEGESRWTRGGKHWEHGEACQDKVGFPEAD